MPEKIKLVHFKTKRYSDIEMLKTELSFLTISEVIRYDINILVLIIKMKKEGYYNKFFTENDDGDKRWFVIPGISNL